MSDIASLMNITSSNIQNVLSSSTGKASAAQDSATFDGIFNAAVNMINSTNEYLQDASAAEVAFAAGELTSVEELAAIEQKASLSLQYTVAVKNQLLSAYQEIMNIQI